MRSAMENALREPRTESRSAAGDGSTPPAPASGQGQGGPGHGAGPFDFAADANPNVRFSASRFTGRRVHFIGIGGSGMSGLARMLLDSGAVVTGSEPKLNAQTIELAKHGAQVSRGQMGELLSREIDLVVRTAAVKDSNPEFQAAGRYGIR